MATTSAATRQRKTIAQLVQQARKVEEALSNCTEADDAEDDAQSEQLYKRYQQQAKALLDEVQPLLDVMVDARLLEASYIPDLEALEDDEEVDDVDDIPHLSFYPGAGRRKSDSTYEVYASRLSGATQPPPALIMSGHNEDYGPFHPAVFMRVPVVGHVVLEEEWQHDGEDIRVIHSRPILADPSNVEFVSQSFNVINVQPTSVPTVAVFGTLDAETDLRDYSWDIESLQAEDIIILLGYDFEGCGTDWVRRLLNAREEHRERKEEGSEDSGVYLRGEYRKLPKLDIRRPEDEEHTEGGD